MKINGKEFKMRGSNHKYYVLDDLDNLYQLLLTKSIAQLSKELDVPQNSIRYRCFRYFSDEQLKAIKKERRFHKKQKSLARV